MAKIILTLRVVFNRLICYYCKRDINALGQDNMSSTSRPMCEDCYNSGS